MAASRSGVSINFDTFFKRVADPLALALTIFCLAGPPQLTQCHISIMMSKVVEVTGQPDQEVRGQQGSKQAHRAQCKVAASSAQWRITRLARQRERILASA